MSGKGAQVIGHGLAVADIGEYLPKQADPGRCGRNGNSRKRHQGQHADGLEGNRLPAGIGTADHQDLTAFPQIYRNGNDLPSLLLQVHLQQGVASPLDLKYRARVELGKNALELPAEASLGKAEIEDAYKPGCRLQLRQMLPDGLRQRPKDAKNLFSDLFLELDQPVVELDTLQRFNEEGRAGGAAPVDHTGKSPLAIGAHRDDEPLVSDGHHLILQRAGLLPSPQQVDQ